MAGRAQITTPFPSLAETAHKYGLSETERREVESTVEALLARRTRRSVTRRRVTVFRAKKKK